MHKLWMSTLAAISIIAPASSCSIAQRDLPPSPEVRSIANNSEKVVPTPVKTIRLLRGEGFPVPDFSEYVVFKSRYPVPDLSQKNMVYATWYRRPAKQTKEIVIDSNLFTADEFKQLGLADGFAVVSDVLVYELGTHVFAYLLHFHPRGVPATRQLIYLDEDGDGAFETIESGSWQNHPKLPTWSQTSP